MATGSESLASRRVKRHVSWKQNWADVKRHNLVRPKSVRNRHSRRSHHERSNGDSTDDSSLGDLFSDSTGVESDGRDLHNSASTTSSLATSTSSLISTSTTSTPALTSTSTSAAAASTSTSAVVSSSLLLSSTKPVAATTTSVSTSISTADHTSVTEYVTATLVEHIDMSSTWVQTLLSSTVTSSSPAATKTASRKVCSARTSKPVASSSTTSLPTGTGGLVLNPAVQISSSSSLSYSMPTVSLTSSSIPTSTSTSSSTIKMTLTRVTVSTKSSSTSSPLTTSTTSSTSKSTGLPTTVTTPLVVAAPALQTSSSSLSTSTTSSISAIHTGSNSYDSDSDNDGKTDRPPRQGLSGTHTTSSTTAAAAAATTSAISSSSSSGGLSETAEHFVISTASIASFAAICAIVWFIMRYMRKRKGGEAGASRGLKFLPGRRGNSSSGGESIFGRAVAKIPYVRDKFPSQNRRWHNLEDGPDSRGPYTMPWNEKNAGVYAAPSLTSQNTGSSTTSSTVSGSAPTSEDRAITVGLTGIGPIAEIGLLTPMAAQTPGRTSGISWTTSVDDSLTVTKTNSMISEGSRNFQTHLQPMPMPAVAMTATAAATATAAQVAVARRDSIARRDSRSSRSSGSSRSSAALEGVSATLTEPYTTDLSYSSSFRSARAQYGGEDTLLEMPAEPMIRVRGSAMNGGGLDPNNVAAGDYRYSELSSLSSGFGDGDIVMPLRTGDAGARGTFLAAPGMIAVRSQRSSAATSQEPKTPPPVAMRESWSQSVVGQRDTVFTAATDDSSPARFRTVSSWVQQQTGQVRRAQRRAEKNGETHVVPDEPQLTLMMPDGEVPRPVDMNMR